MNGMAVTVVLDAYFGMGVLPGLVPNTVATGAHRWMCAD